MGEPLRAHLTWNEYQDLPEDGIRYEIIDGEILMSPAPAPRHQTATVNIVFLVEGWRRSSGDAGMVFTAPVDVILAFDTIVQPDLVYVRAERVSTLVRNQIHGAPDLVVEIFQRARADRDRVTKLQVYARFRIPEYWLVDLDARTISILGLADGGYEVLGSGSGDTPVPSRVLPGLTLIPAQVFDRV